MSFLDKNNSEYLSARLTQEGRKAIAKGDFKISYFSIGDSEFNYSGDFKYLTGSMNGQKTFAPLDKDGDIKYPLLYQAELDTIHGIPVTGATTEKIRNVMGPAGFISGSVFSSGSLVASGSFSSLSGNTTLSVAVGSDSFIDSEFVTLILNGVSGTTITEESNSYVYKLENVTGSLTQTLTFDRPVPILTGLTGTFKIVGNKVNNEFNDLNCNECLPPIPDSLSQHDSWTLNTVWSKKPIGFQDTDDVVSGFTSSKYLSTKEFLGYQSDEGQLFYSGSNTIITGTTFVNSFGEKIEVLPSEQNCIAILHYSEIGDIVNNPDRFFKYDDYVSFETTGTTNDLNYFEVYIPYIDYHRNTGTTIGAKFTLSDTTKYIQSLINPSCNIPYRDLLDEQGYSVGKVFADKKIIVFDDQEIVAVLDYKSNRKYTLPTPKLELTHSNDYGYILNGVTGETLYISYVFSNTNDLKMNGLPCMNIVKITGSTPSNIVIRFTGSTSFDFLKTTPSDLKTGILANKLYILAQRTTNNNLPDPSNWKVIDKTSTLTLVNDYIPSSELTGRTITLTGNNYDVPSMGKFILTNHTNNLTSYTGVTNFGDEQPFPGSIKLVRATDIEEMNFIVNLPDGKFATSQNPTYVSGDKMITEVALLNSNKKPMVIAKTASPIKRSGSQVFAVKLDF